MAITLSASDPATAIAPRPVWLTPPQMWGVVLLAPFLHRGLIEGSVAPNVISPGASAEIMLRIVGEGPRLLGDRRRGGCRLLRRFSGHGPRFRDDHYEKRQQSCGPA